MEGDEKLLGDGYDSGKSRTSTTKKKKAKESVLGRRKSMNKGTQLESMQHIEEGKLNHDMPTYLLIMPGTVLSTFQNQPSILTKTLEDKKLRLGEVNLPKSHSLDGGE